MRGKKLKGSITVFLSLTCILFLSLICAVTESARVQGAKAQSANITGMGTFSLMSEFETDLLKKYDILALDGAAGGNFRIKEVNSRFEKYIIKNTDTATGLLTSMAFDPWNLSLQKSEITGYTLLTDDNGEAFYQQAVSYMKDNLVEGAISSILSLLNEKDKIEKNQENYENSLKNNDEQLSVVETEKQEQVVIVDQEGVETEVQTETETEAANNPLKEINKLRKMSLLDIVAGDKTISSKSINILSMPSKSSSLKKGTISVEKTHKGITADAYFYAYLMEHFPDYSSGKSGAGLDYQLEYILGGKASDKENLKYVINRLLLVREGMNYAYSLTDTDMLNKTSQLANVLTGFLGMPPVTVLTQQALLLAWPFGESLIDVRILLDGGKVPLWKSSSSWSLTLGNLSKVTEIISKGGKGKNEGVSYKAYLIILLEFVSTKKEKMRALDMIQKTVQAEDKMSGFKVNNCIVAVETSATYKCGQVFFGLPALVMGLSGSDLTFTQTASMAY